VRAEAFVTNAEGLCLTPKAFAVTPKAFAVTPKAFAVTPKAFAVTPKAFANFSPGLERSDNPGGEFPKSALTLKGFANRRTLSGFD